MPFETLRASLHTSGFATLNATLYKLISHFVHNFTVKSETLRTKQCDRNIYKASTHTRPYFLKRIRKNKPFNLIVHFGWENYPVFCNKTEIDYVIVCACLGVSTTELLNAAICAESEKDE